VESPLLYRGIHIREANKKPRHFKKGGDKMAEIVVAEGTSTIHCAIMMNRSEEARKVISECLPFRCPMPCGEVYTLLDIMDLPENDLPCTCGNPTHWFVKYKEDTA